MKHALKLQNSVIDESFSDILKSAQSGVQSDEILNTRLNEN